MPGLNELNDVLISRFQRNPERPRPKAEGREWWTRWLEAVSIVFFDINTVIDRVPQGQIVDRHYHLQVDWHGWENDSSRLMSVKWLRHARYLPDLARWCFWLFSKLKTALKGTHFGSVVSTDGKYGWTDALNANGSIQMEENVKSNGKTVDKKSMEWMSRHLISRTSYVYAREIRMQTFIAGYYIVGKVKHI